MAVKTKNTMIGRIYPFFLDCRNLSSTWYLYQVVSPGLSEDMCPMITLRKIGEKVGPKNFQMKEGAKRTNLFSSDIISTIIGKREMIEKNAPEFLRKQIIEGIDGSYNPFLKKYPPEITMKEQEMPAWEIVPGSDNYLTKLVIIELRDKLRWNKYRFSPGNFIDLLISPTKFGVLEIMGTKDVIWLEHRGIYSLDDPNMTHPLLGTFNYPQEKFEGDSKASTLNRVLRKLEWKSFSAQR